VTAPVHGFRGAHDYYTRSSSLTFLGRIRRPTLLLSAMDDPFLPSDVLEQVADIARRNRFLTTQFSKRGGHVGFVGGSPWNPVYYAEQRVGDFLAEWSSHSIEQQRRPRRVPLPRSPGAEPGAVFPWPSRSC